MTDFSGDIIRAHEAKEGWRYVARYAIWKEPLTVRNRTMVKCLAHRMIVRGLVAMLERRGRLPARLSETGRESRTNRHPDGLTQNMPENGRSPSN